MGKLIADVQCTSLLLILYKSIKTFHQDMEQSKRNSLRHETDFSVTFNILKKIGESWFTMTPSSPATVYVRKSQLQPMSLQSTRLTGHIAVIEICKQKICHLPRLQMPP